MDVSRRRGRISTMRRWAARSGSQSGDYLEHLNVKEEKVTKGAKGRAYCGVRSWRSTSTKSLMTDDTRSDGSMNSTPDRYVTSS